MSEIEAIKIIMDSYQKGRITECIVDNQLDGAEKLKIPNMDALIDALAQISSKHDREEICKEIESSSCNLEFSLEDIARGISENEVILDSNLLKIVLCRVWKNVIDLDTVDKTPREEYDYTTRYWFGVSRTFERKYTSKLQDVAYNEFGVSNILNKRDEEPYHTAKVLGESVARANKSVTELPEVVLDDPIFLYHYICQSPLTYEDGEKTYNLQDKWSVYPEYVEEFSDFVYTAQQELEEYKNGISVARPNETLAGRIIKQYIQDLQQRGDIVFEGMPLFKEPIEGEDIHVGGGMSYYLKDVKYIINGKEYIVKCYYHGSGSVKAPDYKIPIDRAMIGIRISDKED